MFPSLQWQAVLRWHKAVLGAYFAAVLLSLFAIDACVAQAPSPNQMTIPLTTIQKGNFSGIRDPLQVAVRTQDMWESLWKRHTSIQSPPLPAPAVNFTTEMVVGLFAGEKTTGGYEVEITRAEVKDSTLYIYYVEKSPASGGMAIQALTQPFYLAKLPRYDTPVVFVKLNP
jgi:hypothetical protein